MKRLMRDKTVPCDKRYRVLEPVMTVEPGETILVETINHMTPVVKSEKDLHPFGSPEYREREETGPIYVTGAKAGDALSIYIEKIEMVGLPHAHGWSESMLLKTRKAIGFPIKNERCILPGKISIPVSSMIGDIYTTPYEASPKYYDHGGNMDFTEIKPDNTLYLPVFHDGGLLVLGDVHAAQGDGELLGEGAECAADVTVRINIDRKYCSQRPLIETPTHWITLACRETIMESKQLAIADMIALLQKLYSITEDDARTLCLLAGSLRVAGSLAYDSWMKSPIVGISVSKDMKKEL
jgi:amidase